MALAEAIGNADVSVDAAIHDLNLWSIRDALLDAERKGVAVRLVFESSNLDDRMEMQALADEIDYVRMMARGVCTINL